MSQPSNLIRNPVLVHWLVLGIALLVLGGIIAFKLSTEHARTQANEEERLLAQTRVITENMERQLASASLALESVRTDLPQWQGEAGLKEQTLRLKALCNTLPGIRSMGVMDASGTVLASSRPEFVGHNFSNRDYFKAAQRQPHPDTLYVSPPFKSVTGAFVITVTRAITGPRGEFAGIVTAILDPEYFKTLLSSVLYAPDMWDAITHGDGVLFVMVPKKNPVDGLYLAQPGSFFSRHRDSGQASTALTGTVSDAAEIRMMAQRTIHPASLKMDKPLVVAVSRNQDEVFQAWRRDALTQAGLYALIAIVSILGLYAYQRRQRIYERQATEAAAALQQTVERLHLATEASGIGVWDYDMVTGQLHWDDAMFTMYGIDKSTVSSMHEAWQAAILPEDRSIEAAARQAMLEQGAYAPRFRIRRGDGSLRYIQGRARVYFDATGKPARMVGTNEDVTDRQQRQAALLESEERFRSTFDAAAIGMALVSPEGRFMKANNALCSIVGYTEDELCQKTYQELTHPDDLEENLALIQEVLAGIRQGYQMEKRYFHKDGHIIWVLLSGSTIRDETGQVIYFIAQIQDITERKTLLEKLERQANRDYLTGLSNRRHFLTQGEIELSRAQRYGHALSLFMLDIDYFKKINDAHGHKAGDIVLQQLSTICQETLRAVDIIGRIGGEEFAILLPETDIQEAAEVAERLRGIIADTEVSLDVGLPLHFTISIGVASLKDKNINLDTLLNLADKALYEAKNSGRNRVCIPHTAGK